MRQSATLKPDLHRAAIISQSLNYEMHSLILNQI